MEDAVEAAPAVVHHRTLTLQQTTVALEIEVAPLSDIVCVTLHHPFGVREDHQAPKGAGLQDVGRLVRQEVGQGPVRGVRNVAHAGGREDPVSRHIHRSDVDISGQPRVRLAPRPVGELLTVEPEAPGRIAEAHVEALAGMIELRRLKPPDRVVDHAVDMAVDRSIGRDPESAIGVMIGERDIGKRQRQQVGDQRG